MYVATNLGQLSMRFESDTTADNSTFTHLQKVYKENNGKELNQKSLIVRSTGRFYTHELIGRNLIISMLDSFAIENYSTIRVIEPFCGDGRLICWLLEETKKRAIDNIKWEIELWECDHEALSEAVKQIKATAAILKYTVKVTTQIGDSFKLAQLHTSKYHICITNPPWEVLKPDHRELKNLVQDEVEAYINNIREMNRTLEEQYPISVPSKKFAGWGMNLARCGVQVAITLTASNGVCGVVSPASLLADQMSDMLRRWIFQNNQINNIHYYAAETRLFDNVDQSCITLVALPKIKEFTPPNLTLYKKNDSSMSEKISNSDWNHIKKNGFVIPLQFGINLVKIARKLETLSTISDLEGTHENCIWAGRELDETGYQTYLSDTGKYLFAKGKMIKRYGFAEQPDKFIKEDGPNVPKSANMYRLVWRDVARQTQKRRMHATILPPGMVTGNSLNVLHFRNNDLFRLKALLAIMNSFIFEAQVRMYLATSHVSLGAVRKVRIPDLSCERTLTTLVQLVDNYLDSKDPSIEDKLEVYIAKMYALSSNDFLSLLLSFDKVSEQEREQLLSIWKEIELN